MNIMLIFFVFLPSLVFGQHILDYTNEPLNYWVQINNIGSLTTEYKDNFSSSGQFEEIIKEELFFDSEHHGVKRFRSFRTIVDTTIFPKIQALLLELEPDTSYIDYEELTTEIYTTTLGKYVKSHLIDANGLKIFEKIYPKGLKPIYMKYLEEDILFNQEGNIEKYQVHSIFGWNDWEYYFDTLSYRKISYNLDSKIIDSWEKETSPHHIDYTTKTTIKKNSIHKSIKYVDTVNLTDADLSNKTLQAYFETKDLNSLVKINHPSHIEYLDSKSGKKLYLNPPFSRHNLFYNRNLGYQETIQLNDGLRLKNYLVSDTSNVLLEVIEIDENGRVQDYYSRSPTTFKLHKFTNWRKRSYEYLGSYPFLTSNYSQRTNKPIKNPERHWFKKEGTHNVYENWLSSSYRFIDDSNFELMVKNTKYLVKISK